MSSSKCQWTCLRPFVFSSLAVLCFLGLFLTYKSDIKFPNFGVYMEKGRKFCPSFLCAETTQIQDSNLNNSTEPQMTPHPNVTQKIQAAEPDTIILIWLLPFGQRYDISCSVLNITKCTFTYDRALYHKAHGLLFHHRNIGDFPTEPRPSFQKWVWFNMESPANSQRIPDLNNIFNLTCSYRLDSTIPVPYGHLEPVTPQDESFKLPAKDKLVCWIVSNWGWHHKRVHFYNELKKHINIHTYGNAFGKRVSDEDYSKIVSSCKFYLSFENSVYKDYITEKLFSPMLIGSVPVVLGPPRKNYEEQVPAGSFIHVDDFSTPKKLAERLLYLDQNYSEYMRYFEWTSKLKVKSTRFVSDHACKTCKYLQNHRENQVFHDLNKWYWG